jgi:hypothetical protein
MIPVLILAAMSGFTCWWASREFRSARAAAVPMRLRIVTLYYATILAGFGLTSAAMAVNRAFAAVPLAVALGIFVATLVAAAGIRFSPRLAAAILARL